MSGVVGGLWGGFPPIPGTQLSTITAAQNANPLSIMAKANQTLPYFSSLSAAVPAANNNTALLSIGAHKANAEYYYLLGATTDATLNEANGGNLPMVTQMSAGSNYYTQ